MLIYFFIISSALLDIFRLTFITHMMRNPPPLFRDEMED